MAEKERRQHHAEKPAARGLREVGRDAVARQVLGIVKHEITDQSKSDLMVRAAPRREA